MEGTSEGSVCGVVSETYCGFSSTWSMEPASEGSASGSPWGAPLYVLSPSWSSLTSILLGNLNARMEYILFKTVEISADKLNNNNTLYSINSVTYLRINCE